MENREEIISRYFGEDSNILEHSQLDYLLSLFSCVKVFCTYLTFDTDSVYPSRFFLNFERLYHDSEHSLELKEITSTLVNSPEYFFSLFSSVVHLTLLSQFPDFPHALIAIQISKYDRITSLSSIRSATINQFVSISGTVTKVSPKRPFITSLDFECLRCHKIHKQKQQEGKFTIPRYCECTNTYNFKHMKQSAESVNCRRIKIQENSNEEHSGVPLTIECEARDREIPAVSVGDPVTVMGIVRAESTDQVKNSGLFGLYIEIVTLIPSKRNKCEVEDISSSEIAQIRAASQDKRIFHIFLRSICPMIYGHEKVKAGLLLALFGGNDIISRGAIHILVVGDPGLGKTQLIRTAAALSARGIYVSATTKAGLTINFARENGQHMMRAGALVMADGGVCAIDELDKMGKEQEAMLEVMEQQTITVAKAGIYCTLRAKATVLAAANPSNGHYNSGKSLTDNLKVSPGILNRFDLIFLVLDNHVNEVSSHVIKMHSKGKRSFSQAFETDITTENLPFEEETFTGFVRRVGASVCETVSDSFFKKYVAYALNNVHPKLSREALEIINAFYISLRRDAPAGSLPVSARLIHSLKRLTEARAKVELREIATEQDAVEIVKLFQETAYNMSARPAVVTKPMSNAKLQAAFLETLEESGRETFTVKEMQQTCREMGFKGDFYLFLDKLNNSGVLIKKGKGLYQLVLNY